MSIRFLAFLLAICFITSCSSVYYGTMEKFGYQKRDILVSRVDKTKQSQEETKEQFANALEAYLSVVSVPSSDLEKSYRILSTAYEDSKQKSEELSNRIDAVEDVAEDLFEEWEDEIELYSNRNLARKSTAQLRETKKRYKPMMRAMREAESKVRPVLVIFYDQVLFLKHNLNAQAIIALKKEAATVENDVKILVREMEDSIAQAELFIAKMSKS